MAISHAASGDLTDVRPPGGSVRRTNASTLVRAEQPPHEVAEHEEWLLDEALAETFPASDPIAVSPLSPKLDKFA